MRKIEPEIEHLLKEHDAIVKQLETVNKSSELYGKLLVNLKDLDARIASLQRLYSESEEKDRNYDLELKKLELQETKSKDEREAQRRETEVQIAKSNVDEEIRLRELELKEKESEREFELEKLKIESNERIQKHEIDSNLETEKKKNLWSTVLGVLGIVGGASAALLQAFTTFGVAGLDEERVISKNVLSMARDVGKFPKKS